MNTLEHKGYQGRYEYDPEAGIFHGDVLLTRDVVTFQGRSLDELQSALMESVECYLEFCAEQGKTPDQPCGVHS